jgi:hypothetical protein
MRRPSFATISIVTAVAVAAWFCPTGATPLPACGNLDFLASPIPNGVMSNVTFAFDPRLCSAPPCSCSKVAYVQMIRVTDGGTGQHVQPWPEQARRMVKWKWTHEYNGWAIDRLPKHVWGYFARDDNGDFSPGVIPGSNANPNQPTPAILRDTPTGYPLNTKFEAVSVPVCIDENAICQNWLLGFQYWEFVIQQDGSATKVIDLSLGRDWHRTVFDLAVDEWNRHAWYVKNQLPPMSSLPGAE